jgi:23S rRNA (pseudouridine1915-N3)-methyltransferase
MHISIAAIGRASARFKKASEEALLQNYLDRIPWQIDLKIHDIKKPMPTPQRMQAEGEWLLDTTKECEQLIALDENGKLLSSKAFSEKISGWEDNGIRKIGFIIGGADGLSEEVKQKATMLLAFGTMTWPHMLARVMLAEQLYRAYSITTNHPYHRE